MRSKNWIILLAMPLLALSCIADKGEQQPIGGNTINVSVGTGAGIEVDTRTTLDSDGITVKWAKDDQIALWARNSAGQMQLDAHQFRIFHYNATYSDARFTDDIDPMPEGVYTYMAMYPVPASRNGTQASFTIPAAQDGTFSSDCNIMLARAVEAPALVEGDNSEAVTLHFQHKIHLLRITLPTNLLGEKIDRIVMTFPGPVTGLLMVDAAAPDAAPVLSAGSNVLTLDFAEPIDAGQTVCAIIAPVEFTPDQTITLRAYSETRESKTATMAGKKFAEGRATPIKYNVSEPEVRYTVLDLALADTGEETLGEKINTFTLTAPTGSTFDNGSNVRVFEVGAAGRYRMLFLEFTDDLSGKTITVDYDSANALIRRTFTMPQITAGAINQIASLSVPYLFDEDFSGLAPAFESNTVYKLSDALNPDPIELDQYGLAKWTGGRVGGAAGVGLRIASRTETGLGIPNRLSGRADSAPLSNIKAGRSVNVKVSFDYAAGRYNGVGSNIGNPLLSLGWTTTQGKINIGAGISNAVINEQVLGIDGNDQNQSYYGTTPHSASASIAACVPTTRLTWLVHNNRGGDWGANGMYWVYIDNIKVSIVQ